MVSPRKHRRRERGAAVFIVVLIIAMLTAIGMFAATSASLSTTAAGHERLATQTQYLTEYGVNIALSELERNRGWNVTDAAMRSAVATGQPLPSCAGDPPGPPPSPPNCWAKSRYELEDIAEKAAGQLVPLIDPPGSPQPNPGSLGYADLDWDVRVELSKEGLAAVAGMSAVPDPKVTSTYCKVTVIARGALWPKSAANQIQVVAGSGAQSFLSGTVQVLCSAN
jgi:hypothetical protein